MSPVIIVATQYLHTCSKKYLFSAIQWDVFVQVAVNAMVIFSFAMNYGCSEIILRGFINITMGWKKQKHQNDSNF